MLSTVTLPGRRLTSETRSTLKGIRFQALHLGRQCSAVTGSCDLQPAERVQHLDPGLEGILRIKPSAGLLVPDIRYFCSAAPYITGSFGLEETFKGHPIQLPCNEPASSLLSQQICLSKAITASSVSSFQIQQQLHFPLTRTSHLHHDRWR